MMRGPKEVYDDFAGRRKGILAALTTEVDKFYSQADPAKDNLCLFGYPDGTWAVDLPAEEVPPETPEPPLGINFARDGMQKQDWIGLVAVHSDAWLLALAFYKGARLHKEGREELFKMINANPTCYEIVSGRAKEQAAAPPPQVPGVNKRAANQGGRPIAKSRRVPYIDHFFRSARVFNLLFFFNTFDTMASLMKSSMCTVSPRVSRRPFVKASPPRGLKPLRVLEVTQDSYETEVLKSDVPVIVDFWATWCGPCKLVSPIMDWAQEEYGASIKVVKVEHDANPKLIEEFKVYGLPALIMVKDGAFVPGSKREGAFTKAVFTKWLTDNGVTKQG
eukprot:gene15184-21258_t